MNYSIKGVMEILSEILNKKEEDVRLIDKDSNLETYGLESIEAIRLVIALEEKYDFEFQDEDMIFNKFNTINKLLTLLDAYLGSHEEFG